MTTTASMDVQRERWRNVRSELRMVDATDPKFATGGLGLLVPELSARVLILPEDPLADVVKFDEKLDRWLKARPTDPFRSTVTKFGSASRQTSQALVEYEPNHRDAQTPQWESYLAIRRSGAIDVALSDESAGDLPRESGGSRRAFWLINLIGRVWVTANLAAAIATEYSIAGPFEISVALRNTAGAIASDFASGWLELGRSILGIEDVPRCVEPNALARLEIPQWANDGNVRVPALKVGEQVANAFGVAIEKVLVVHNRQPTDRFDDSRYH